VQVFAWDGSTLRETARLKVSGGSAALRTDEKYEGGTYGGEADS
jgi:hypothetical protein